MQLLVEISKRADGNYVADCPGLPGCRASGSTHQQAMQNIERAIEGYLASLNVVPSHQLKAQMRQPALT